MKLFSFVIVLAQALSGLAISAHAQKAESKLVNVTGTKVSLAPPPSFTLSEQFPGFSHEETGSSILVTEMPAPFSAITAAFTKELLTIQQITLLSRRDLSLGGKPAVLLHLRQIVQEVPFLKWMVATGTGTETVIITATFPEQLKARLSAALEKSVLSARWDSEAKVDPLAGLTFTIQDDPAMKFARRISNAMLLTKDGTLPGKPANDPLMIIAPSLSQAEIPDVKTFAEARLREIAQVSGIAVKKQSAVTIAGLPGSEIVAEAAWKDSPKDRCVVYQTLLVDGKNYFLLQGFAPLEEQQKYLEIFGRITQSFHKK
jgi:hypothetical protein